MNASRPKQRRLIFHSKFTAQILNTSGALYYFDNSNAWVKHHYRDSREVLFTFNEDAAIV